jgi:hypothetical protein
MITSPLLRLVVFEARYAIAIEPTAITVLELITVPTDVDFVAAAITVSCSLVAESASNSVSLSVDVSSSVEDDISDESGVR